MTCLKSTDKYVVLDKEWISKLNPIEQGEISALIDKALRINNMQKNKCWVREQDESLQKEIHIIVTRGEQPKCL